MFYRICLALCLTIFVSSEALAQLTPPAPPNAEMDKFPVMPDTLSQSMMAVMGLRLDTLEVRWEGFNHFRNVNRFAWDVLPVGTLVLVDPSGTIRYKADCGNRLVELQEIEDALTATGTTLSPEDVARVLNMRLSGSLDVTHHFDEAFILALSGLGSNTSNSIPVYVEEPPRGWWSRHWGEVAIGGAVLGGVACAIWCRGGVEVNVTQIN